MVLDINTLCKVKGCHVQLEVNKEKYEGLVVNVIPATLCVALGKVRCLTDGVDYHLLYFYTYEIESCVVVSGPEEIKKNPKKPNNFIEEDGPRLVKLRPLPFHKRGKTNANTESNNLLIEGTDDKKNEYLLEDLSDKSDDEDDDILPSEKFRYPLPSTNVIIDVINDDFHQAISNIKNETAVGVSVEGENIGRHGRICWISISTESHVYLFDILTLGDDAFGNGLRDDVFQNPLLMKVFHDCREPSDALHHVFETRLVNIFDTQSSDALLQYKLHNRMPRYVRSLVTCIKDYLKLEINIPELSRTYQQHSEKNMSVWIHRPLPKRYMKVAAKHCIFLKELRFSILERYIADLNRGAEIFLSIVRDSSEQELDLTLSTLNMLPTVFEKLETKSRRNTHTRRSFEAPLVDSKYCESSKTTDPYAAAGSFLRYNRNAAYVKENKTVTTIKLPKKDSKDNDEGSSQGPTSGGDFEIQNGSHKPSDCLTSSLKEKNYASTYSENKASLQSEKYSDVLSKHGNQFYARSHPKKRIDWPKVSSQISNSASHVNMIPAGMISTN